MSAVESRLKIVPPSSEEWELVQRIGPKPSLRSLRLSGRFHHLRGLKDLKLDRLQQRVCSAAELCTQTRMRTEEAHQAELKFRQKLREELEHGDHKDEAEGLTRGSAIGIAHEIEHLCARLGGIVAKCGHFGGVGVDMGLNITTSLVVKWDQPNGVQDAVIEGAFHGAATAGAIAAMAPLIGPLPASAALGGALLFAPIAQGAQRYLETLSNEERHLFNLTSAPEGGPDYKALHVACKAAQTPARALHAVAEKGSHIVRQIIDPEAEKHPPLL